MIRALGALCLGGGFLAISPKLRTDFALGIHVLAVKLNEYTPYSYILLALGLFALLTVSLHRSSGMRR